MWTKAASSTSFKRTKHAFSSRTAMPNSFTLASFRKRDGTVHSCHPNRLICKLVEKVELPLPSTFEVLTDESGLHIIC